MKISIFGTGYVGLVAGLCYTELGHDVLCYDNDFEKINKLQNGESVIYEEGIDKLLNSAIKNKKIKFSTDIKESIAYGEIIISAVGTPGDECGNTDLSQVISVANYFGEYLSEYKIFINKSTVPVGTGKKCRELINKQLEERKINIDFDIVSNPEFLSEGNAINNFLNPDRIVYGTSNKKSLSVMRNLYKILIDKGINVLETDLESAEIIKYASNSYLAMKLSFINEISNFGELVGANIDDISKGIGLDKRIGINYLKSGIGYGGSCFSKDIKSFINTGKQFGYNFKLLEDIEKINEKQKLIVIDKLLKYLNDLEGKTISILGLSYKEGTDDLRDAPSLIIIEKLLGLGAKEIKVYDPKALNNFKNLFKGESKITYCELDNNFLNNSDGLLLLTSWEEFNLIKFDELSINMKNKIIIDGRNFLNKEKLIKNGFIYEGIGK